MTIDTAFNNEKLIFFETPLTDAGCTAFLILDNLNALRHRPVNEWLTQHPRTDQRLLVTPL